MTNPSPKAVKSGLVNLTVLPILALAVASGCSQPLIAAEPGEQVINESSSDIVVTARTRKAVDRYVEALAKSDPDRQVPRWNDPICLRIVGMAPRYTEIITKRFQDVSRSLQVRMLDRRCAPNVTIDLTYKADATARALVDKGSNRVGNRNDKVLLDSKYKAALLAPRTVRWITATNTVNADGSTMAYDDQGRHIIFTSSLIAPIVKESLLSTTILIDADRLAGVTLDQLADYLVLISLARPDITADYSRSDSILSLFSKNARPPAGLSAQDLVFLKTLYSGSGAMTVKKQRVVMRRALYRDHLAAGITDRDDDQ